MGPSIPFLAVAFRRPRQRPAYGRLWHTRTAPRYPRAGRRVLGRHLGYRRCDDGVMLVSDAGLALPAYRVFNEMSTRRGMFPPRPGSSDSRCGSSAAARSQIYKKTRPRRGFAHGESAGPRTPSEIIQSAGGREPHPGEETTRDMHAQRAAKAIGQGSASAGRSRPHNPTRSCLAVGAAGEDRKPPRPAENPLRTSVTTRSPPPPDVL